ncbi:hypothetical protein COPCOM_03925 [Coprococcus comes ATCC 27758]|uniref:Uncharacterized protein n=1 Tax=Coprococcus comes ATCC 27758 TaxID=470146 RepID=C0BFF7_9FIRM|nr:hypothetical protein COPCOM_03925 [Coprococcus comes ATCC 27758]
MTAITDDNPVANLRFFTFLSLAKTISFKYFVLAVRFQYCI